MTGNRREFKVQVLPVRVQDDVNSELLRSGSLKG